MLLILKRNFFSCQRKVWSNVICHPVHRRCGCMLPDYIAVDNRAQYLRMWIFDVTRHGKVSWRFGETTESFCLAEFPFSQNESVHEKFTIPRNDTFISDVSVNWEDLHMFKGLRVGIGFSCRRSRSRSEGDVGVAPGVVSQSLSLQYDSIPHVQQSWILLL